ncbi:hypothetical protein GQ53DRAFT_836177 [Thozetella sp. PMI_491]|nr:hypothetical protein GQ53DRAFT_836177 [Thozetella sp. PMI_491]
MWFSMATPLRELHGRSDTQSPNSSAAGSAIIIAAALCPAISTLFVVLRFYTCRVVIRRIHLDDWLILSALLVLYGYAIAQGFCVEYGSGASRKHGDHEMISKLSLMSQFLYSVVSLLSKCSILVFFLRFATSYAFAVVTHAMMFIVVGSSLTSAFGFLYLCAPMERLWEPVPGTCVDVHAWFIACASLNVFTDAVILLLPIWLLQPLRIPLNQRIAVLALMMAGGFVLGVSIYRLKLVIVTDYRHIEAKFAKNTVTCLVELSVAIVCACMPCLRALVAFIWPSFASRDWPDREPKLNTIRESALPSRISMPVFNREVKIPGTARSSRLTMLRRQSTGDFRSSKLPRPSRVSESSKWYSYHPEEDEKLPPGWTVA